jgi:acetylornithine deacetylase/succinyl-diaminopimelate desuccinylase-like protein
VARHDPAAAAFLAEPMLAVTLSPVMAEAGVKENVIPSRAEVLVDCRVPPELGPEHVRKRVDSLLGAGDWELDFEETVVGNRSEPNTALWEAIEGWAAEADPGAALVPVVMAGFSDSHWFRAAFGATVYGFCPHNAKTLSEAAPLIHGTDERAPAADLELAAGFFRELPKRVLG